MAVSESETGIVKGCNASKGYGFISRKSGAPTYLFTKEAETSFARVFACPRPGNVHDFFRINCSAILMEGFKALQEG